MGVKKQLAGRKIGVLYGGMSAERKISLLSGKAVLDALHGAGVDAVGIDAGPDLPEKLKKNKIDFAYIALHGSFGEDGTVQGILEIMGIPYSGCGVLSSALAMNKIYTKMVFDWHGIPTPEWRAVSPDCTHAAAFALPAVVKPANQGSTIGISVVRKKSEYASALKCAFKLDREVLVEKYIKGTEITVGILGNTALPAMEIVPANEYYDYESKYKPGCSRHIIPPRLPEKAVKMAGETALKSFKALGCRAVARVDIIVDGAGKPWVLEVNTIPGMTETSLLPDMARAAGLGFGELVLKIIEYSLEYF